MDRSPIEVAVLVIAGLIDGCERRSEVMGPLTVAVRRAVAEIDPDRLRDTRPTWWQDLDPWARLDALDRLRLSHDNLLLLEEQAGEITMGLRSILTPHTAAAYTYRQDHQRLVRMAAQRGVHLNRLRLAAKRLRPRLSDDVAAELSRCRREFLAQEKRGERQLHRLGALLSMADHVMAS